MRKRWIGLLAALAVGAGLVYRWVARRREWEEPEASEIEQRRSAA